MFITIITIGAKPKAEISVLIDSFTKRLPKHIKLSWRFLKHGSGDLQKSVATESESILRTLPQDDKVILLDETGKSLTSPQFASDLFDSGNNISIIIGGAYGVSDEVKARADMKLSLGKLVYPHQIVRLIISEQIYRAYTIHIGHPYHHQ